VNAPFDPGSPSHVDSPIITLLTDFGTADYFVAAMKAVILSVNPHARIVDITHEVAPQDVQEAAFTLLAAYLTFPKGTIHVAVVDPGVGSARSPIVIDAAHQLFVGPDNGIFSYVCERDVPSQIFRITNREFFRQPVSSTFHGRDIFAPVAAALSMGVSPEQLGAPHDGCVRLESLEPKPLKKGGFKAHLLHIDRFGNCVTNITRKHLPNNNAVLAINGKKIDCFKDYFAAEELKKKKRLFAIWGSAGFLEIAAQDRSAAEILKARRGDKVEVKTL
jgi:S-adenosylmethionine hydrolase